MLASKIVFLLFTDASSFLFSQSERANKHFPHIFLKVPKKKSQMAQVLYRKQACNQIQSKWNDFIETIIFLEKG